MIIYIAVGAIARAVGDLFSDPTRDFGQYFEEPCARAINQRACGSNVTVDYWIGLRAPQATCRNDEFLACGPSSPS